MLTNLWLLSLFFLANILITLAFLSYSWIYVDAFLTQRSSKDAFRGFGGFLMSVYFILNVVNSNSILGNITLVQLLIFTIGLFSIFYGNLLEPVPGVPDSNLDARKFNTSNYIFIVLCVLTGISFSVLNTIPQFSKISIILTFVLFLVILSFIIAFRKSFLEPNSSPNNEENYRRQRNVSLALLAIPFFSAPLLSILVGIQTFKKVFEGLSKEFKLLGIFWGVFSAFSFIQLLSLLGQYYFVFIDTFTRQYSIIWILNQLILIVCAILMYRWISLFISFRVVARLFLYIWQISILLTVVLASTYSILVINSSESQVSSLLTKNAALIQFNLDQIKSNNQDILKILGQDNKLITAIVNQDAAGIESEVGSFVNSNSFLDKVQVTNENGTLVFDSEQPTNEGESLADNQIISKTVFLRTGYSAFIAEENGINSFVLDYQFTFPVVETDGTLVGIITTVKRLDNNFLDLLKKQTGQELIIYINNKRSASTILQPDNLSRLENIPLIIDAPISTSGDIAFYKGRILTTPYYLALLGLKDVDGANLGSLVIGTPQSLLIDVTEGSLYELFLLSLAITLAATIPSYFLAKNLRKDISA